MQPNNPNQFTEKAWAAIAQTPDLARQTQQQQIEPEHLMKALLEQDGLATSVLNKAGFSLQRARDLTNTFIQHQPKVSGSSEPIYISGRGS